MSLTGGGLLLILGSLTLVLPFVTVRLWHRAVEGQRSGGAHRTHRNIPVLRDLRRFGLIALCQASAVLLCAAMVNDQFDLYVSWSDLFGGGDGATAPVQGPRPGSTTEAGRPQGPPLPLGQRLIDEVLTGPQSHVNAHVWLLLPPGYDAPTQASYRYPVVEFLSGYPGSALTWLHALNLQHRMDAEIDAGRIRPFIAVLPTMNVVAPRDAECTDIPNGPQVATWLGVDVPLLVRSQVRTLPFGQGWGVTGYSTGGFCATKLLLIHHHVFKAAASLSGYFTATTDATTGDLFGGSPSLRQDNDPLWLVAHRRLPDAELLVMWSSQDPECTATTPPFLSTVARYGSLTLSQIHLLRGGHNTRVWSSVEPQVLAWFSAALSP